MIKIAIFSCLLCASVAVQAQPVFVSADEDGQGFLRQRGNDCYLVTPQHVLGQSRSAEMIAERAERFSADLQRTYDPDLAIMRVAGKTGCPTRFPDGGALEQLIHSDRSMRLATRSAGGALRYTNVEVIGSDDRFILIAPKSGERLFRGLSGSPLMIGGSTAGMLQTVDAERGTGRVLRQDYLSRVLESWFPENSVRSRPAISAEVHPTIPTNDATGLIVEPDDDTAWPRPAISGEVRPARPLPIPEKDDQ